MLLPKKNRVAVYSHLFKEGTLVAKKDVVLPKHNAIDVPNLEVLNLMKSLKSRGYVRETFCWQYFYWYLTDEGVEYLREFLHLPAEVVPQTHKKAATAARMEGDQFAGGRPGFGQDGGFQGERGGFGRGGGGDYRRDGGAAFGRGGGN